jgi:hypothetical protein
VVHDLGLTSGAYRRCHAVASCRQPGAGEQRADLRTCAARAPCPSVGRDSKWAFGGVRAATGTHSAINAEVETLRPSVVAKAQRSPTAVTKQTTGCTADGLPVHSFHSLIADLATLARNTVTTAITPNLPFTIITRPPAIQQKALDLLAVTV